MPPTLKCSLCAKVFSRTFSRKRHEQTKHSEAPPPYRCSNCDRSFSRSENLKRHQDSYHGPNKVPCGFCQRRFRKDYLYKHRRACKPNLNHLLPKTDHRPKCPLKVQDSGWQKTDISPPTTGPKSPLKAGSRTVAGATRKPLEFIREAGFRPLTEVPLHNARIAIMNGNLAELEDIIGGQSGPWALLEAFDKAYSDARGETMLTTAVRFRHIDVVEYVLESGLKLHDERCDFLKCPLSVAIENGDTDIVEVLIEGGAPLEGRHGCCPTPLIEAIRGKQVEVVEQLLEHGVSMVPAPQATHPLFLAIRMRAEHVIDVLLQKGVDPNLLHCSDISPTVRVTALYQAALHDQITVARDLIDRWKVTVNLGDSTPLEAALQYGSAAMVELLLNAGADLARVTDTTWEDVYDVSFYPHGRLSRDELYGEIDEKKALLHRVDPAMMVKMDEYIFADSRFTTTEYWLQDVVDFDPGALNGDFGLL